jgi:hypothetical protein
MGRSSVAGFTVKSYRNPSKVGTLPEDGNYKFAPDPLWDDDEEWSMIQESAREAEKLDDMGGEDESITSWSDLPDVMEPVVPEQDDAILDITKKWVRRI